MKKVLTIFLATMLLGGVLGVGSAQAFFMQNWTFDADGAGANPGYIVSSHLDLTALSYVKNTPTGGGSFTFENIGFIKSFSIDGGAPFSFGEEITAVFKSSGVGNFITGALSFNTGFLEIYSDLANPDNYGSTTGLYGANDGTKIASFSLVKGVGAVLSSGLPDPANGVITLDYIATYIRPGYWKDSDDDDLAYLPSFSLTFGQSTTNANLLTPPTPTTSFWTTLNSELAELYGAGYEMPGVPTEQDPKPFLLSSNGQFRVGVVPEPTTALLLGVGLLGLGYLGRRKRS